MFEATPIAFAGPQGDLPPPGAAVVRPAPAAAVYFVAGRLVTCAPAVARPAKAPAEPH